MWMVKVRILPPQPIFPSIWLGSRKHELIFGSRQAGIEPAFPSAVHRFHVGVAHLLQIFRNERGAKTTAAIQNQLCARIRDALLDVALNNSAAQVYGVGNMPF